MIYLDNNSTTRTAPAVVEAMHPYWSEAFFNPASLAADLNGIRMPLDLAVDHLATLLNASANDFTLTSGATESNNWVLQSVATERLRTTGSCHFLISAIEHPSIIETAAELSLRDPRIVVDNLPVDHHGVLNLELLSHMLRPETALVSVMLANNETGAIQPVADAARRVKTVNPTCLFHTDATQAVGKIPIDLDGDLFQVDLLSLSAHKFHGPKSIGALFIRSGVKIESWIHGGTQQRGTRAGTENPALAMGFAKAVELVGNEESILARGRRISKLRNAMEAAILVANPAIEVLGFAATRLPNTSLLLFPDQEGEMLVHQLLESGIAASTGSACSRGTDHPSHVVTAMGIPYSKARNALRLSLSSETSQSDAEACVAALFARGAGV
jgi:cysteine desulfurase